MRKTGKLRFQYHGGPGPFSTFEPYSRETFQ
jgi:hypothetical protein